MKIKLSKLKSDIRKHGWKPVHRMLEMALIEDKGQHRLRPDDFSIREVWEEMVGPCHTTLGENAGAGFIGLTEDAVDSAAFSNIIGVLIAAKVIEGYNMPGYIGDRLVTTMPSKLRQERYAGFTAVGQPREVAEGMPYEETGFHDKFSTSEAAKKGRLLNLTEEAILFDQTGQLLMRAGKLGEQARLERETVILQGVVDFLGTVFSPQGVAQPLYRLVAVGNSNTINLLAGNALVDWTDIDNIMQIFAAMTDDRGNRIVVMPKVLLVPYALSATANRILRATEVRTETAAGTIQTIGGNPISGIDPLTSPLLDAASATTYYLGDFPKQFVWQQIWPLQVTRKRLEAIAHNQDIIVSYKVRYFGGIAAIDDKYVVESTI